MNLLAWILGAIDVSGNAVCKMLYSESNFIFLNICHFTENTYNQNYVIILISVHDVLIISCLASHTNPTWLSSWRFIFSLFPRFVSFISTLAYVISDFITFIKFGLSPFLAFQYLSLTTQFCLHIFLSSFPFPFSLVLSFPFFSKLFLSSIIPFYISCNFYRSDLKNQVLSAVSVQDF